MGIRETDPLSQLSLPPGFRFYPTDEELLVQYLCKKVAGHHFNLQIIGDIDLYKFDPWVLPSKAIFGEKEWYFFSPRDRKYPNGSRPNRVAGSGYWKATGTDKVITTEGRKVGIKKALVFYVGKAPKGTKTNWIMHEYRLSEPPRKDGSAKLDDWVLCRIYKKNSSGTKPIPGFQTKEHSIGESTSSSSRYDDVLEPLPEIDDRYLNLLRMNSVKAFNQDEKVNLQNIGSGSFDWATLAGLTTLPELSPASQGQRQQQQGSVNYGAAGNHNLVNGRNDFCVPTFPQMCHVDEEVQSGIKSHRVDNSMGLFQLNSNGSSQGYSNSVDPFGIRYPTQSEKSRFRH